MTDWCFVGDHEHCRPKHRRFYIGPVGKGRQKKDGIIWLDEWVECDCKCHKEE